MSAVETLVETNCESHLWDEVPTWLQRGNHDPALRICLHCGANGRAAAEGIVTVIAQRLPKIDELIARSSIGAALLDVDRRGIDAHAEDLARETSPRRRRKKAMTDRP